MYDLIIIGAGPAGLSAAVYAARAELDFIVIEPNMMGGGQVLTTSDVENYLGLMGIGGFEMGMKFKEHADKLGVKFVTESVTKIECDNVKDISENDYTDEFVHTNKNSAEDKVYTVKKVYTDKNIYETKSIILATGASHKKLGVVGEEELAGKGVSYCATCDGAFFRGKTVAVVGGGDVAVEDALYLSRMCNKVYLIHRRDEFRAAKSLVSKARSAENIEFVLDSVVERINGNSEELQKVGSISVKNKKSGEEKVLEVSGIFIAVGMKPVTEYLNIGIEMNDAGYIIANEDCTSSIPGVFAAGDIRTKALRQIITAASDGANAVYSVEKYLN